ncbi:efflux RND transporter permease subunit [Cytophagaceae bacterium ABcell3]|nr:efflux RND transporter permease subunit [Cytophagaceae bacterium ABcell3]
MSDKVNKQFGLTTWAVRNRTTVLVLTFIVALMGVVSYIQLPKENFPDVKIPTVYIGTTYPGNSPRDIENLITRPIEKEVGNISGIDKIASTSSQDFSSIVVEFTLDVPAEEALRKVKDAVDKAKKDLPNDLDRDPEVNEVDVSEFPIMNINLSGDFSNEKLKEMAEHLEDKIEKFPEISKVDIRGLEEKEVKINVDMHKMASREVTFNDIENAISNENITMSGGSFLSNGERRDIRVTGEFIDPLEMENIIVKDEKLDIVYLRDIAKVEFGYKDKESYARLNKQPVVMLDVVKKSGENLINASKKINELLAHEQKHFLPADLMITITNDQSQNTVDQVSSLENNIISGVILVVLVLLFFLGSRNSLFVGVAIPLSMFLSFMILGLLGITINMMVLFGLIMALGMLVDNGIVVVENVYRLREEGLNAIDATIRGVGEVAFPIISSTATTLAAFLPLAFWPGIMGEFMKFLPVTLIITLGSSLFVALVINPVLVSYFMNVQEEKKVNKLRVFIVSGVLVALGIVSLLSQYMSIGNLLIIFALINLVNIFLLGPWSLKFQNFVLPKLERGYEKLLSKAVKTNLSAFAFFGGTVGLLVFSLWLLKVNSPKVLFFPENEPQYVNVFIEFPVGTDIEVTNKLTAQLEDRVFDIIAPYEKAVESVVAQVGEGTGDPQREMVASGNTPHKGRITVAFHKTQLRDGISTTEVMEKLRSGINDFPGVSLTVDKNAIGPPVGKPISIEVVGRDLEKLYELSEQLRVKINNSGISGIEALSNDMEVGKPELIVDIDREKARRFGVSTVQVASILRTALFGKEVSKYKEDEDDFPIQVRLDEKYRHDIDALMEQLVIFRDPSTGKIHKVPISAIAKARYSTTSGSIKRTNQQRVANITSNVLDGFNATEINDQIRVLLSDLSIPVGYEIKFTGQQEKQQQEMEYLSGALLFAVFLIFLIIVGQFNKVSAPFIIMTSVLFSTIGVFLGLVIFNMEFVVIMTMIGIISLAGIVVNNAIVLIDFIELIKRQRQQELGIEGRLPMPELIKVIVDAGKTRLRPVLLTAITTILGLIPLAVGLNIDFLGFLENYDPQIYTGGDNAMFWGPMAWTIIFGLTFATFLTLVIVPVMYLLIEKFRYRFIKA